MAQVALQKQQSSYSTVQDDVRIDDFLNDKLQTTADLENIDALLQDVRKQHDLLKTQVFLNPRTTTKRN